MLRLKAVCQFSWRVFRFRSFSCEPLISQMNKCEDEEQIFDFIGRNKATLSENQVGCAFTMLWEFQKQKTSLLKNVDFIKDHPQFVTLYDITAKKIELMNDDTLVNVLYITQQFSLEAHDPLIEALVTEAWRRMERFDISLLSKFSSCLADQHLYFSPLMGKIADIANRNLETIQDLRSLSVLMVNISSLISKSFQEQLIKRAELLFDSVESSQVNIARRLVQFLRNIKYPYYPLLDRCNQVFISNVDHLDLESISKILSLYHSLQFYSFEFSKLARKRLADMIPLFDQPANFVKLFVALGPIAGTEEKKRLQATLLLMSEELTSQQALAVIGAMEEMESRNSRLIKKIASTLHKHLDSYKPIELLKIIRALIYLHFQSKELFMKLRELLLSHLKTSIIPSDISALVSAISLLPSPQLDEARLSRIEEVLPQCDLNDINVLATSVLRWIHYDHMYLDNLAGKQLKLLQKLDQYGLQRLQKCNDLNLLWEELKTLKGDWFSEALLEEAVVTLERLVDEINYTNVTGIATFISRTNYLSSLLLDKIASVVTQHIEKIHPFSMLAAILPFSILNYDPLQRDEFLGTFIQHLNSHLGKLDPLVLVFLGFSFATLEYFPEDLLKAIFNIKFLAKLDSQLEYIGSMNEAQQQIYKILAEILGGTSYVKASVLTPYYHTIDFECILDKRKKPLSYGSNNITLGKLSEMPMESNTQIMGSRLPPGAVRVSLEFLDSKAFCRNIPHLKGKSTMKKRHLEILGYHVIQIPHFEWNSMALSTKDARMAYLRNCIFEEGKSQL
ncbi:FAST kinase domain-containing protein 1, mitochondrial isoform X2 [Sorex fumeus]|uniref:FAST kinase domain-containing protein 1, mitochondrial isoform X2 n=1 Tax=Sorex fumeus TaxID=62283 RepID=UPI0024AE4D41|nr:FAST kinase domain-containing protein 1, mitochondrial isoform X2 [Sorex fumeus]